MRSVVETSPSVAVREARERARLSQRALARLSGVSQPNIAAIEAGRRVPTEATLGKLLKATRVRPSKVLASNRDEVLRIIEARGGSNVRVFGSVAGGTDTDDSDLDLLVDFEPGTTIWEAVGAELDLEEALGIRVDIVPDDGDSRVLARARTESEPL